MGTEKKPCRACGKARREQMKWRKHSARLAQLLLEALAYVSEDEHETWRIRAEAVLLQERKRQDDHT